MPPQTPNKTPTKHGGPRHLLSKAEMARVARATRSQISRECKPGGKLRDALVGERINASHPNAVEYVRSRGGELPTSAGRRPGFVYSSAEVQDLLRLRSAVEGEFGSVREFRDWAKAKGAAAEARDLELKGEIRRGSVIGREMVKRHVFGYLDSLAKRLFTNAAPAIVMRVAPMAKAQATDEDMLAEVRGRLSTELQGATQYVLRALRQIKSSENSAPQRPAESPKEPDPIQQVSAAFKHRLRDRLFGEVIEDAKRLALAELMFEELDAVTVEVRATLTPAEEGNNEPQAN